MNYYERHLGDYARDAGHLSMIEHGAYTLLLDRIYAREEGIPADQVHRFARSADEVAAIDAVLAEFFILDNGVWINGRAMEEIERVSAKRKDQADSGRLGGLKRAARARAAAEALAREQARAGGDISEPQGTLEQASSTPVTKHQTPEKKKKPAREGGPITFAEWIASLPEGTPAIAEDHHAFAYAERAGIPLDFVQLAWIAFERKYTKGENAKRKYKDWPDVFRNAIEGNWLSLWYIDADDAFQLTTVGKQLQRAEQGRK